MTPVFGIWFLLRKYDSQMTRKKHKRVMKQADRNKINDKPDIFLFAD